MPQDKDLKAAPDAPAAPEPHPLANPNANPHAASPDTPVDGQATDGGVIAPPGPVTLPGKPPRTRPQIRTPAEVLEDRKSRKEEESDSVVAQLTAQINEYWDDTPIDVRLIVRHKLWERVQDSVIADMGAKGWTVAEATRFDEVGRGQEGVTVRVAKAAV
jgi:hypothetical protein